MNRGPRILPCTVLVILALVASGCHFLVPEVSVQPLVHNPFPQLSRVAIAPFINLSDEPTVDGAEFAMAYYSELQAVRGFEVVPLGVTEQAIVQLGVYKDPSRAAQDSRLLAQHLGVDVVVVGAVTDFDPYYPPRCGMRVEWYAANKGFHPIPAGYGLPWGTPEEEFIPESLVFEAEMALAREQLATQSPDCPFEQPPHLQPPLVAPEPQPMVMQPQEAEPLPAPAVLGQKQPADDNKQLPADSKPHKFSSDALNSAIESLAYESVGTAGDIATSPAGGLSGAIPAGWPDARGFIPPGPSCQRAACMPHEGPVMTHTRIYHGHDPDFTAALASYVSFRDDARFGGWQSYLQRSDDFVRFCAHLHISEMLTARGGGGESRVVRRWSESR